MPALSRDMKLAAMRARPHPFVLAPLAVLAAALLAPSTARAVASAELYRPQSFAYGRFEARIRYAAGDGVISSFFLWKPGSEMPGVFWNELDFEKLGADCHLQTNALYGLPQSSSAESHSMPSDLCDAYHDYAFEWTPTYIAWLIDGQEIRRTTGAIADAFAQNASSGMELHFNIWPGNANFGGNFDPAILPVHQYISWVQYSSYQGGAFTLQWREEFTAPALPSWATGNWGSPYNLSTHSPANVGAVDGIAVLSLTADGATGFSGTPPPDDGAAGAGGAAGSAGSGGSSGTTSSGDAGAATAGGPESGGGGSAGSSSGGAGSGATPAGSAGVAAGAASDSGCGCRVARGRSGAGGAAAALLLVLCAWWRRRRGADGPVLA